MVVVLLHPPANYTLAFASLAAAMPTRKQLPATNALA
jgi:hypothetical protein